MNECYNNSLKEMTYLTPLGQLRFHLASHSDPDPRRNLTGAKLVDSVHYSLTPVVRGRASVE